MKKTKGYMLGGKTKGMSNGGKLKMTTNKQGKEVPFFAADGVGKMSSGRKVPTTKGYFIGGKTKGMAKGGKTGGKTIARGSGAARPQEFGKNG
jgi:hypothetical protein